MLEPDLNYRSRRILFGYALIGMTATGLALVGLPLLIDNVFSAVDGLPIILGIAGFLLMLWIIIIIGAIRQYRKHKAQWWVPHRKAGTFILMFMCTPFPYLLIAGIPMYEKFMGRPKQTFEQLDAEARSMNPVLPGYNTSDAIIEQYTTIDVSDSTAVKTTRYGFMEPDGSMISDSLWAVFVAPLPDTANKFVPHGTWYYSNRKGKTIRIEEYKNGNLIEVRESQ